MAESDQLVEVLKEIRDELRAVRIELDARGSRMTTSGVRTERVARQRHHDRWRSAALAAGGVAGLALVIGLVMRDRSAPVAVSPQFSSTSSANLAMPAIPTSAAIPPRAPAIPAAPVAAHATIPAVKPPAVASTPVPRQRLPAAAPATALASIPAPAKGRVKSEVAAKSPAEVASDEDETLAFRPPPKRVRVHRLSYGPVESEPAKL